jgi:ribA/ribD-fused uncharacterized protein
MKIERFDGEYRFLSNFWPAPVWLDTVQYPTVEHAYQAAKFRNEVPYTQSQTLRQAIFACKTPAEAKRLAKRYKTMVRLDWAKIRYNLMNHLVYQKFTQHKHLGDMLRATGTAELVEGNWWGDTYWGVCNGIGSNWLGVILMNVRSEISHV